MYVQNTSTHPLLVTVGELSETPTPLVWPPLNEWPLTPHDLFLLISSRPNRRVQLGWKFLSVTIETIVVYTSFRLQKPLSFASFHLCRNQSRGGSKFDNRLSIIKNIAFRFWLIPKAFYSSHRLIEFSLKRLTNDAVVNGSRRIKIGL